MNSIALVLLLTIPALGQVSASSSYDPLQMSSAKPASHVDVSIPTPRQERLIPVRVYLPADSDANGPSPVILFSHGLGGSREGSPHLGRHWASRGFVVVFLQHLGSDASVWQDVPLTERMKAMNRAASPQNFSLRNQDVKTVLDQLTTWQKELNSSPDELRSRVSSLDLNRIGMSGHSFGGITTQAVSGQRSVLGRSATDARIKAAIVLSPSSPKVGNAQAAFGKVSIPWFVATGTKDVSPIGNADVASRLAVFDALPAGNKYQLVLFNAEHSFPNERGLPSDSERRNPNHVRAVLALTTAFWDAFLGEKKDALEWLNGTGPRTILEKEDDWQVK